MHYENTEIVYSTFAKLFLYAYIFIIVSIAMSPQILSIYLCLLKKHSICIHLPCSKIFCINLCRNFVNLKVFSKHVAGLVQRVVYVMLYVP